MALSAAMVAELVHAGLTGDALIAACERLEIASKPAVKSNAQRQAEWRCRQAEKRNENNVTSVTDRNENNARNVTPVTPSRDIQNAPTHAEPEPNITTYPTTSEAKASSVEPQPIAKPKSDRAASIAALAVVVGQERAVAVVDHRAKLKKPLTPYAAGRLAASLGQAPDPRAAADEMIERGWQGWKAEWGGRSQGPPRQVRGDAILRGLEEIEDLANQRFGSNVQPFPRIAG